MPRVLTLLALAALASCKKDQAPVAPGPPAARSPWEAVPAGDGVLSVLEPVKGACEWRRVDTASGEAATVASVPGTCVGARVAWSADAKAAVLWFEPALVQSAGIGGSEIGKPGYADEQVDPGAKPRLYSVAVGTGAVRELPPLPPGEVGEVGLDAKGDIYALSVEPLKEADVAAGKTVVDGKELALTPVDEGLPALAHAWRLAGDGWKRAETAQTTTGWDYGPGVRALGLWKGLGPRTSDALDTHPAGSGDAPDEATVRSLEPLKPKGEGEWIAFGKPGARLFSWGVSGEFLHTTGHVVLEAGKAEPAAKVGFTDGDLVAIRVRGPFALVAAGHAGAHPRLYELSSKALRWSSDTARATAFWP